MTSYDYNIDETTTLISPNAPWCFRSKSRSLWASCVIITACLLLLVMTFGTLMFLFGMRNSASTSSSSGSSLVEVRGVVNVNTNVPINTTIAFIADTALNAETLQLYQLVKQERAEALFIYGDMDYVYQPEEWDNQITSVLGADFPVFVAEGNHDTDMWPNYARLVSARYSAAGIASCHGLVGITETCSYKGLLFVSVSPGSSKYNDFNFTDYLSSQLTEYNTTWKVCMWHRNQHIYQTGDKSDEVGYGPYQACLQNGAMIVTGHEHQYSRTYLMSSFDPPVVSNKVATLHNLPLLALRPGASFAIVNGLGGRSVRTSNQTLVSNPWWAKVYDGSQNAKPCALICTFHYQGNPNLTYCYLKQIDDTVIDQFYMTA